MVVDGTRPHVAKDGITGTRRHGSDKVCGGQAWGAMGNRGRCRDKFVSQLQPDSSPPIPVRLQQSESYRKESFEPKSL